LQVSGSEQNVEDAGGRKVEVLLVGMNPGPFGMAQVHLTSIAQDVKMQQTLLASALLAMRTDTRPCVMAKDSHEGCL
jgi:hypothetical protein